MTQFALDSTAWDSCSSIFFAVTALPFSPGRMGRHPTAQGECQTSRHPTHGHCSIPGHRCCRSGNPGHNQQHMWTGMCGIELSKSKVDQTSQPMKEDLIGMPPCAQAPACRSARGKRFVSRRGKPDRRARSVRTTAGHPEPVHTSTLASLYNRILTGFPKERHCAVHP